MIRKVVFLTGTRADFGKLKSLMHALEKDGNFEVYVFVTGMHMLPRYGNTGEEVEKAGFRRIFKFINQKSNDTMDSILANTIQGLSSYIHLERPDLIVIHGDRAEALAGAIVGAFNNILVAHIEGGEVSGTIDESIRHSISKLAHLHFVANEEARSRLIQMGEPEGNIFAIGSPDLDLMAEESLPTLEEVKERYEIRFDRYSIFTYHPVTTSLHDLQGKVREVVRALKESGRQYVVIYPNNDPGSDIIIEELETLRGNPDFRIFPSVRFEAFLVLLRHARFMIGNSSAAIREAPYYGIRSINIGNRQDGRCRSDSILNVPERCEEILRAIGQTSGAPVPRSRLFGDGRSTERFVSLLKHPAMWEVNVQKRFVDFAG